MPTRSKEMTTSRKIIEIDEERCTGCGLCAPACAEGAIQIVDGKARLVSEVYCDGLGACLGECPEGALRITERESQEFDPEAVEEHLKKTPRQERLPEAAPPCGCPSQNIQTFGSCEDAAMPTSFLDGTEVRSALTHWPVQIRLVPANAPFLQDADLLIAADCTPVAYPHFHRELLPGRIILVGCPKFDDTEEYVKKFTDIFTLNRIKSITVADMEVPCCAKLPMIVKKALETAKKKIPFEEVVIGTRGEKVKR
jgi:ferredoxin